MFLSLSASPGPEGAKLLQTITLSSQCVTVAVFSLAVVSGLCLISLENVRRAMDAIFAQALSYW